MQPDITITLVDRQWVAAWRTPDGVEHRQFFGSRLSVQQGIGGILTDVRGDPRERPFPDITEEIELRDVGKVQPYLDPIKGDTR